MSLKVDPKSSTQTQPNTPNPTPQPWNFFRWWAEQIEESDLMEKNPTRYCTMQWRAESSTSKRSKEEFMQDCQTACAIWRKFLEWDRKN